MGLDGLHGQTITNLLPYNELAQLHCIAAQARFSDDLAGNGNDLARSAGWQPRSACGLFGCGDPVLPDHHGTVPIDRTVNSITIMENIIELHRPTASSSAVPSARPQLQDQSV